MFILHTLLDIRVKPDRVGPIENRPYRSCLFHLIPARYDHDHRFNGFFLKPFITKVCFTHTPKCVSRHTWITQLIKKHRQKKPKGDHSFKKRGGGRVRQGMIMITDSMGFFYAFPNTKLFWVAQNFGPVSGNFWLWSGNLSL